VKPGEEVTLRAFVVATVDQGEVMVLMGEAPGQNYTAKAELHSGGIVGNVTLQSRPRGAHVSDVFVKPSVRKKQLGVDVELSASRRAGRCSFVASLLDEKGKGRKALHPHRERHRRADTACASRVAVAQPAPVGFESAQPLHAATERQGERAGRRTRFSVWVSAKCGRRGVRFI
jgi:hypothetical protein